MEEKKCFYISSVGHIVVKPVLTMMTVVKYLLSYRGDLPETIDINVFFVCWDAVCLDENALDSVSLP